MKRDDVDKLLGGYATGTLTAEEREALFAAALEDQQLFEALAGEEPLRELLQDPIAKARLLAGLERRPAPWYRRWIRPAAWAIPAAAMAAVVVALIVERPASQKPVTIAEVRQVQREMPAPVPSPLPLTLEKRALPPLPRLVKDQPAETVASVAAPAAAVPPPPSPAVPAAPPVPPPEQQVSAGFGISAQGQQGQAGFRVEPATGLVGGVGGQVPVQDARALFFGAPGPVFQLNVVDSEKKRVARPAAAPLAAAAAIPAPHLGIRYRLLKKLPDGEFAAVNPNEVLEGTNELVLRLETNEPGYLSVFERRADGRWQAISSRAAERLAVQDTPVGDSGDLFVVFTVQAQAEPYPVPETPLNQVRSFYPPEQATYVASTQIPAAGQTVAFPITLRRK